MPTDTLSAAAHADIVIDKRLPPWALLPEQYTALRAEMLAVGNAAVAALASGDAAHAAHNTVPGRWSARQNAYLAFARGQLHSWIDSEAILISEATPGEPVIIVTTKHEDLVIDAILAEKPVPQAVIDAYPGIHARAEAIQSSIEAHAAMRERQGG